jgi:MFS family permease
MGAGIRPSGWEERVMSAEITARGLSGDEHRLQLRRALVASTIGTLIEWYDFLLYGTVSALIFGKLFFPHSSPLIGVLEAFSVFFIGFIGRPIGAAIFGHWGDRIGRKATLIATLLVTGLSTVAVGLVPTYASIGIWGAVLLTIIRLIQGIGVGGEWGGSVLLAMEWARTTKNRGFLTSWPQFGAPAGFFLANLAVLFFSWVSGDQFITWGWRIPFFLSIIMVGIGLWIRLGILETPVFQRVIEEERVVQVPVLEVLKRQPKQVLLSALLRMPEQAPGYIVGAFIFTYGTTVLGVSRDFLLVAVLVQCVLGFLWVIAAGTLSDRVGRKNMFMIGCVFVAVYGFIYFGLLDTKVPILIFIAVALSLLPVMTCYGPEAALIAESFTPRLRYSGTSLGYQLASIIAGGPAPMIATALFAAFHWSLPIALYMVACAVIGVISTSLLTDYTSKDISAEYEWV